MSDLTCSLAGGVGKSALAVRFVRDVFIENYDPTIEGAMMCNESMLLFHDSIYRGVSQNNTCRWNIIVGASLLGFFTVACFYFSSFFTRGSNTSVMLTFTSSCPKSRVFVSFIP